MNKKNAHLAVEEGNEHRLSCPGSRVRKALDAADRVVREDGTLA